MEKERKNAIKGLLYIVGLISDIKTILKIKDYAELLYFQNKRTG